MDDGEDKENLEELEDVDDESGSVDSFINDDSEENSADDDAERDVNNPEEPLTDIEIEELINELIEVESKAAEAQESLEEESLAKVEADVREELRQNLSGEELEKGVMLEMKTFKEEWEAVLDELEAESSHLLEQLDGAGIELPSLYKWIENQVPDGCCTDAWKRRAHWVGSQLTSDAIESIANAEKYLQVHRPVRRRHGKILEEGASGFLGKKLAINAGDEAIGNNSDADWSSFNKICSVKSSSDHITFGSKDWVSVYLASTPQQAAELGLKFPGVDEVEEIDDIEEDSTDPFVADAVANEGDLNLTEEQKKNFRKVKEEEDASADKKLRLRLKRRRHRKHFNKVISEQQATGCQLLSENILENDFSRANGIASDSCDVNAHMSNTFVNIEGEKPKSSEDSFMDIVSAFPDKIDSRIECFEGHNELKSDGEDHILADGTFSPKCHAREMEQTDVERDTDSVIPSEPSPVNHQSRSFQCTACDKVTGEVHLHPLLRVIVCLGCKTLMEIKMQEFDCSECYCGWCGQTSDLRSCRSCKFFFCISCIKRNLGENILLKVQTSSWDCCVCVPSMLQHLTTQVEEAGILNNSSSDTDSSSSDEDVNNNTSTKRRRKKKIRRILDDAELGEETKKKIAIEKERQERLKSLGAQFSMKTSMSSSPSCTWSVPDGASVEVFGEPKKGYIVNVVKEEGEEPVRIPPSISIKLKPHQIAGIRFMWENIVQSVRKVKSGDKGLGCILAHTMGLGKTFQVIAFLYTAMRNVDLGLRTALIVTPVSVLHYWRTEFIKWRPSELKPLKVFMLEDVPRERRAELLAKWKFKGGVFLMGYTAFRNLSFGKHIKDRNTAREISVALQDGPDILVCDEAHMIKNTRADITQALKQVKCQRRIALTGSPLQNNLMEYYCMVDFVREGFLGSSHEFRNRFQNPIENGQHTNSTSEDVKIMNQRSHILYEQLKGFVQRVDMNVVKKDLPPKTVFVIAVKLSPLQRKLYKKFLDVHGFTEGKVYGEKMRKRSFFAGYQALLQIWNHPGTLQLMRENCGKREEPVENFLADYGSSDENVDYNVISEEKLGHKFELEGRKKYNSYLHENWWRDYLQENDFKEVEHSGKMVLLLDILTKCSLVGDKALVFSQSLLTLDLIENYLSKLPCGSNLQKLWKRGKDWYRLDGRTVASERQRMVERFNDVSNRRVKCALISTKAGSLGINLHAANRVIIIDGSWNPTYDLQAIYRVWRYGQTKPVFAYRLLAHGSMEEKIYKRQVTKEGLAARVVDRQQVHRTISKEEMLHLFEFGDEDNTDFLPPNGREEGDAPGLNLSSRFGGNANQNVLLPPVSTSSDPLMQNLVKTHQPSWIANYHEHETLLQENEEEKLSKEEQEMAWEVYRRTFEWEEVKRVSPDQYDHLQISADATNVMLQQKQSYETALDQKPMHVKEDPHVTKDGYFPTYSRRTRHTVLRKCTNLSHLLTLRSQGTKVGCTTVCGECAHEISWEDLNKNTGG